MNKQFTLTTINQAGEQTTQTFRWNAIGKAYKAYDKAINNKETVITFTNARGQDVQDRNERAA